MLVVCNISQRATRLTGPVWKKLRALMLAATVFKSLDFPVRVSMLLTTSSAVIDAVVATAKAVRTMEEYVKCILKDILMWSL